MSENLDSPTSNPSDPFTELPTAEGPSLAARRVAAGRYEILSKLGKGGMGEVWHAYDLKLRVDVALKSIRLDLQRGQDQTEALRREVRTAREVVSANVCRIFDLVVDEQQDQFLAKLKSFTNLRVVADKQSSTGWKLEAGSFPGWENVPSW